MNVVLRADDANGVYTRFTVFVNGANCGQLCMRDKEAIAFYLIVLGGCLPTMDQFLGKGKWAVDEKKGEEDLKIKDSSGEKDGD